MAIDNVRNQKALGGSNSARIKEVARLASLSPDDIYRELGSRETGLTADEADASIETNGANEITKRKADNWLLRLWKSFASPFSVMLIVVAVITFVANYLSNDTDWFTPASIISIVIASGIIRFVEERKSQRSSESLKHLTENTSTVIRDGKAVELPNSAVALGDVIRLGAGDMLPADARIMSAKDLFLDQAALTGESVPAEKAAAISGESEPNALFDFPNMAFEGSSVVSGTGTAIIVAVGSKTALGVLAAKVSEKRGKTAFEKGIDSVSRLLMGFMAVMVPLVFVIDGLTHGDPGDYHQWLTAFTFALSIAVGLTPALLPMQVASDLAKGAVNMSAKKVIVKDINSIQNFGAMDVLCTDKTGTLTEGNSTLSEYVDFADDSDDDVVNMAFLNSKFQTGIRNQLDRSIVEYMDTKPDDEQVLLSRYQRLDELPFDFDRKMLTILVSGPKQGTNLMITKGFYGTVKDRISFVRVGDSVRPATTADLEKIKATAEDYGAKGARVILVATKETSKNAISLEDEKDMVFLGYITFKDSPKTSAAAAIRKLREYGVRVKVLTGDGLAASMALCQSTGFGDIRALSGPKIATMSDGELAKECERCDLFVKLSPDDKQRIVSALRDNKHTVGFMGDGINDAPALRKADIGISFKDATDIAKEAADIILLENDLEVLGDGIVEGRKSYSNMMKYLKGQTSSNFGNMFSQLIGAIWIPFLPMLPLHIILLAVITDVSCAVMPFDRVDEEMTLKPSDLNIRQMRWFMFMFGPLSSAVDMATFAILMYMIGPQVAGGYYQTLGESGRELFASIFQTGFFIESLVTQNVVYAFLRTERIPLLQSRPSVAFGLSIIVSLLIGFFVIYVPAIQQVTGFAPLPGLFIGILFGLVAAYVLLTDPVKRLYRLKFGRLL